MRWRSSSRPQVPFLIDQGAKAWLVLSNWLHGHCLQITRCEETIKRPLRGATHPSLSTMVHMNAEQDGPPKKNRQAH